MRKKIITIGTAAVLMLALASSAAAATREQHEAVRSAKQYLSFSSFSRAGLIHQLESPYGEKSRMRLRSGAPATPVRTGTPRRLSRRRHI